MLSLCVGHSDCLGTSRSETLGVMRKIAVPAGTLAIIIGIWSIWLELGRTTQTLYGVEIGGPETQAVFGSAILALIGVAAVVWGVTDKS
jgi:hypothetical protein